MAKGSGLGANLYVDGYELGGDIGSLSGLGWTRALLGVTAITKSAEERVPGHAHAALGYNSFFNDATDQSHLVLRNPPTTDRQHIWTKGSSIGDVAACIVSKQAGYAPSRGADGSLTIQVDVEGNGYSLDFGELLTAGLRTDTSATNGTALDGGAASSTGWSAYLQVVDVTGTNVIVTLEDSANGTDFAVFTSSAFTSVTADRTVQRIGGVAGATVRRHVRAVTSGTFSSATFIVAFCRTPAQS